MTELDGFQYFVASRSAALVHSAWLLTGNQATAQDLVQTALVKTWQRWPKIARQDAPEAYIRRVMVSTYLTWNRRHWRGEQPLSEVPEPLGSSADVDAVPLRLALRAGLQRLPRRQRTVIVLRYFEDLTEQATAQVMNTSLGTVKSQTAKALASLRQHPELRDWLNEEAVHDQG